MGKNKRKGPSLEEVLERPWCYYCERDFDDMKILISHQKAKHLKCSICPRRLDTAGGLGVHMQQVHKESLMRIENALPGRENPEVEIFGVTGIPEDVELERRAKVIAEYNATHNTPSGGNPNQPSKKAKLETPEELKRRLAEHKAKKAAAAAGETSGSASPMVNAGSPQVAQVESQASPAAHPINVFNGPAASPPIGAPGAVGYNQPFSPVPGALPGQYPPQPFSPHQQYPHQGPYPPPQVPYPQQQFPPQQFPPQPYSPQAPFPGQPQYPGQLFSPPVGGFPVLGAPIPGAPMPGPPMQRPGPGLHGFAPPPGAPPYMAQPPPQQFPGMNQPRSQAWQQGPHYPPPHTNGQGSRPPQQAQPLPNRPSSLPPAPGLPARPSFDAPPIDRSKLQDLHSGHYSSDIGKQILRQPPQDALEKLIADSRADAAKIETPTEPKQGSNGNAIESKSHNDGETNGAPSDKQQVQQSSGAPTSDGADKVGKLNGDGQQEQVSKSAGPIEKTDKVKKPVVMVVRDQTTSIEEKMARMSQYSYTPRKA